MEPGKHRKYTKMYDDAFIDLKELKLFLSIQKKENSYWWYPILLDIDVLIAMQSSLLKNYRKQVFHAGIQCQAYEERAYKDKWFWCS